MATLISHDKKHIVHGVFMGWVDGHGGFEFDAPAFRRQYCNLDYWRILWDFNYKKSIVKAV